MTRTCKRVISLFAAVSTCAFAAGCSETGREGEEASCQGQDTVYNQQIQENREEEPDYTMKTLNMDQEETDRTIKRLSALMEMCRPLYISDEITDSAGEVTLEEESVHRMIETAAAEGYSVTCGSRDYNMANYEKIDMALQEAEAGGDAETEFYQINTVGVFRYYRLQFHEKELAVTYMSAMYDEEMEIYVQQLEKIQVYRWEYTEKGWLIWEKALTRNQEMDMHIFYRILPLDGQCRDMMEHYIVPVSYLSNNLFLEDWDENSLEKIEFNDLFDYLYQMATGNTLDGEKYPDGIPKEEFETVIRQYFDISPEEIEQYARYDAAKGTYPWSAVRALNRVSQFQPFPEVVRCEETEGKLKVYVEAIYVEEGTDYSFGHVVTFCRMEDGRLVYAGNQVDRKNARLIPGYRPRRELEER